MSYRDTVYRKYHYYLRSVRPYGRQLQNKWTKAYSYYLRGWLPESIDAKIADLGCGAGNMLAMLESLGYRNYIGVDHSVSQIHNSCVGSDKLVHGDVFEFLSERKDTYDLLLAFDLIEHFTKDEALRFLRMCRNALVNGGRLVLQTPNGDSPYWAGQYYYDITHEVCFTPSSLMRLMDLIGFVNCQARETGPVPCGYSIKSTARHFLWQLFRAFFLVWNIAETGNFGSKIFTRVFLITGRKYG